MFEVCLLAWFGGLMLNLTPCVLPLLFVRVKGILEIYSKFPGQRIGLALINCIGAVSTFAFLGGLLLLMQYMGKFFMWGSYLDSPYFLVIAIVYLTLVALSSLGVRHLSWNVSKVLDHLRFRSKTGAFFEGSVMALLASPCAGPYIAAAMGAMLDMPPVQMLTGMVCLGFGISTPVLVVFCVPGAIRLLPKPGKWMVILERVSGIGILFVVGWLVTQLFN